MEGRSHLLSKLGRKLRELRQKRGISQEVLAALAGLNRNYVNQVELGRRNVSIVNLAKLADALGVDLAALVRGIGSR